LTTTAAVKHACHDKLALQDGVLDEAQRTVAIRGSGDRRNADRGQRDRPSVRQGSWSPILSVGWLAAVVIAVISPRGTRRCLQIRRRQPR